MVTDIKPVINALIVVLFITMIVDSPTIMNFAFFVGIFFFLRKIDWFNM